jgi:hypothetical protein
MQIQPAQRMWTLPLFGVLLALGVLLTTGGCDLRHGSHGRWTKVVENGGRITIQINENGQSVEFICDGQVEFSDDDRGINALTKRLRIREKTDGTMRTAEFTAGESGIDVAYSINGRPADFDTEAEAWLAQVIGRAVRETRLGAKPRARRILAAEGAEGVMAEISVMQYSEPKAEYLKVVLANLDAVPDDTIANLLVMSENALSDSQTAKLLSAVMDRAPKDEALTLAILDSAAGIESNSRLSQMLRRVASHRKLTSVTATAAIRAAGEISSSLNCARALIAIIDAVPADADVQELYLDRVNEISSSTYQMKTINVLIEQSVADTGVWQQIARSIDEIPSTSCQTHSLVSFVEYAPNNVRVWESFLNTVNEVSSSSAQGKALGKLLGREGLDRAVLDHAERVIDNMHSSSEQEKLERALEEYGRRA